MGTLNAVNEWKRLRELYPAIESKEVKDEQDRKGNERSPQIRRQGDKRSQPKRRNGYGKRMA